MASQMFAQQMTSFAASYVSKFHQTWEIKEADDIAQRSGKSISPF